MRQEVGGRDRCVREPGLCFGTACLWRCRRDGDDVLVLLELPDASAAESFKADPSLRTALQNAGVQGVRSLVADVVGYPVYYVRRGDIRGLASWARAYAAGMRGRSFGPPSDFGF